MIKQFLTMNQSTSLEALEEWVKEVWLDDGFKIEHQSLSSAYDPNEGDNGAVVMTIMLTVSRDEPNEM